MFKRFKSTTSTKYSPYQNLVKSRSLSTIAEDLDIPFTMNPQDNPILPRNDTVSDIFNSLRIPDAIKDLPRFDGNHRLLHEFINNVEEILLHLRGVDGTPYAQILLRAIRNKIEGPANEVLNMYGTPLIWEDIKNNLILHYSDKRTETSLIRDLHNIRQIDANVENFYSQIVEIQSSLNNNILIHETEKGVIKAKKELFAEMCLNSFLTGLKEPLGSTIRAMRPESLATALAMCIKEQNIYYQKTDQNRPFFKKQYQRPVYQPYQYPTNPNNTQQKQDSQQNRNFYQYKTPQQGFQHNRNYYPNNISEQKYQQSRNFYQNNIPFQQDRNVYQNNNGNVSRKFNKSEPMDTSSGYTNFKHYGKPEKMDIGSGHTNFRASTMTRNTNHSQQSRYPQPNIGQMHHISSEDNLESVAPNHTEPQNITEDRCNIEDSQNFRIPAWLDQQDT